MADHHVNLKYTPDPKNPNAEPLFEADPPKIAVKKGQTISFAKADGSVPGTIRVTFHNTGMFTPLQTDGTKDVTVTAEPVETTYHCELLDGGKTIAQSREHGGDVVPDRTT